jgi:outer membrane protein assembly factor BamB
MTDNCIPTPIHRDGIVWLMSGFRGSMLQAVRLAGAKGDLSGTDHVLWSHGQNTSYTPSALLYGDYLYFLRVNNGVLSCVDAKTGKVFYDGERLGLRTVYSSPVGAGGRVYITSREGQTKVIALGKEYEELASNQLDDVFDASAAIVDDRIYLRGAANLYCIGAK